ncbi:MAG: class I SAM-dependent methyltransferase [Pseudodonghicola sp.]|nr:class I SAM-dependent methyltransferase [Pseudodonghicola sp.]
MLRQIFYKSRKFYDDDFDWENYTKDSYLRRVKGDVERRYRTISGPGDLTFDADTGQVTSKGQAIHPNQQLILEAVGQFAPATVHEVGCGGGDHISNVATLFPDIAVSGGDRGATQLDLALERHPQLAGRLGLQDITMPFSRDWPRADLVYSQAVVMHIHTAVTHFVALANMVRMATSHVLLMENPQCHNFVADLTALFEGGHLEWDSLHLYRFDGSTGARAILASRLPLDRPVLGSDHDMRLGIKPSSRRLKRADEDSARAMLGFDRVG